MTVKDRFAQGTEMKTLLRASAICAIALGLASCQAAPPAVVHVPAPVQMAAEPKVEAPAPQQAVLVAAHPGETVYKQYCATCHDQPEATRSPAKDTLKQMSLQFLNYALTNGKMKAQGSPLSQEQRGQLINYLVGAKAAENSWTAGMKCDAARMPVDLSGAATITHFGFDGNNTRALTAQQAGLTKAQRGKVELAWSLGFPDSTGMRAQGDPASHCQAPVISRTDPQALTGGQLQAPRSGAAPAT